MNYIVLDLEWNQAAYKSVEEEDLPFEIIEIGAVKMDQNTNILGEFQRLPFVGEDIRLRRRGE